MGPHHPQSYGPCGNVLVLLPERTRDPHLVEGMDYKTADRAIRVGSRYDMNSICFRKTLTDNLPGFVYFASYTYFTSTYFPKMPTYGKCAGEEFAAFAGMGILTSYLLLFISFYLATYKKTGQKGRKRSGTAKKAAIDMSKMEVPDVDSTKEAISFPIGSAKENGMANGSATANGTTNGSVRSASGRATRSRKG